MTRSSLWNTSASFGNDTASVRWMVAMRRGRGNDTRRSPGYPAISNLIGAVPVQVVRAASVHSLSAEFVPARVRPATRRLGLAATGTMAVCRAASPHAGSSAILAGCLLAGRSCQQSSYVYCNSEEIAQ
jgi:hypothetical protein